MFYAPNYFVGKGPMGRIWLAAHWDKKLTKAIIEKENILISIEQVFHNKELPPLALRLSGHLLVGITRIYSRKVKYLLADCSDALAKIKMTFRQQAQVDLPAEDARASLKAINSHRLPETVADLDMVLPELPDIDPMHLAEELDKLVAPPSEITIPTVAHADSSILPVSEPAGEEEEDDIYGLREPSTRAEREGARAREDESTTALHIPGETPPRDEMPGGPDFGPGIGGDFDDEQFQGPTEPPGRSPSPAPPGITTPVQSPGEQVQLVPQPPREPPAPKRKRLAVDQETQLTKERMAYFLAHTEEITRDLVVAPPTKKAMLAREWELSSAEALICQPSLRGLSSAITSCFQTLVRPSAAAAPLPYEPYTGAEPGEDEGPGFVPDFGGEDEPFVGDVGLEPDTSVVNLAPIPEEPEATSAAARAAQASIEAFRERDITDHTTTLSAIAENDSFAEMVRKRMTDLARNIAENLEPEEAMPPLNHKAEVAKLFVQLLHVKNRGLCELEQPEPYANITAVAVEA